MDRVANTSRVTTQSRGIVEQMNARLKQRFCHRDAPYQVIGLDIKPDLS